MRHKKFRTGPLKPSASKQTNNKRRLEASGRIKRHPDGFGFLIPDQPDVPDIYIPKHSMSGVLTNDRAHVVAEVDSSSTHQTIRWKGQITEVLERNTKRIAGILNKQNDGSFVIFDEAKAWGKDLRIPPHELNGALPKQLVEVEIMKYPSDSSDAEDFVGKVVAILGDPKDPFLDIQKTLISSQMPREFSQAAIAEAKAFPMEVKAADFPKRKNLCSLPFITIDGATAKDFDDAIYVEEQSTGFELYVAIADVAHYVTPNSAIDKDAYLRGTSTYFPNFVVPMLPEELSNHLCSLMPKQVRLAMVAKMHIDRSGHVTHSEFFDAVICSQARVTYGEAQEIVDGTQIEKFQHVQPQIKVAADLARILMSRRFERGSLDLEVPETELIIDSQGEPVDVSRVERLFAHRLIEELMLAANVSVAQYLAGFGDLLFRIHDGPKAEALGILQKYAETFGHRQTLTGTQMQKRINSLLESFRDKPQGHILHMLTLRSMAQAKYSPENIGHFGLGFENYCHFTSPIRRYPDLIIHRLLKLAIYKGHRPEALLLENLQAAGVHLSACEQRSVKAERQVESLKKARFLLRHVGKEFEGVVTSVTRFGVFVLLREFEIDGLVKLENLGSEYFFYDEEKLMLRAKRSGRTIRLGDVLRVHVDSVDVDAGQINFSALSSDQKQSSSKGDSRDSSRDSRGSRGSRDSRDSRDSRNSSQALKKGGRVAADASRENLRKKKDGNQGKGDHKKNRRFDRSGDNEPRSQTDKADRAKNAKSGSSSTGSPKKAGEKKQKKGGGKRGFSIPISHR